MDNQDALSRLERIGEYSRRAAQVAQQAGQDYLDSLTAMRARPSKVRPRPIVAPRQSQPVASVQPMPVGVTPLVAPLYQPLVPLRQLVTYAPPVFAEGLVEEDDTTPNAMLDSGELDRLRQIVLNAYGDEMVRQLKG